MPKSLALGTELRIGIGDDPTPEFIAVGNLTSIGFPGPTKTQVEVTDFDSEATEFLGGLPDNGEVPFSGWFNYENAGQRQVLADAHDPESPDRAWEIEFPRQGVVAKFRGSVASFIPTAPGPVEAYTFDGTIQVSGRVTFTPAPLAAAAPPTQEPPAQEPPEEEF